MKVTATTVFLGPSIFARQRVIHHTVDLGPLGEWSPRRLGPAFAEALLAVLPGLAGHAGPDGEAGGFMRRLGERRGATLADVFAHAAVELQNLAGAGIALGETRPAGPHHVHDVVYGYRDEAVALAAGRLALLVIESALPAELRTPGAVPPGVAVAAERDGFVGIAVDRGLDISTRALVDAAEARDIPWFRLDPRRRFVQLGHGRYRQRLHETVTDGTGATAVQVASNKAAANRILGELGLPVAPQRLVSDAEAAVRAAERLGYPVVVKPVTAAKGAGIGVGLGTPDEVAAAFAAARAHGRAVIVERFIAGDDHRMLVVDGRLVAVSRRLPGHVVGDGARTVAELVDELNRDPRRSTGYRDWLVRIDLDAEADRLLARGGHTRRSVPPAGEAVFLRATANIATGGTAVDVTRDVHPDNRAMAVQAAAAMGLDVAGVDFLTPDITRSYREAGGAICEVNPTPGLRVHLAADGAPPDVAGPILDMLYPPGAPSRMPIAALAGGPGVAATARLLAHILQAAGHTVGLATAAGITIGEEPIVKGAMDGPAAARLVLEDPLVDAAVLETAPGPVLRRGLGFDACDVAAVLDLDPGAGGDDGAVPAERLAEALAVLAGAARGTLVVNADDDRCAGLAGRSGARHVCYVARDGGRPPVADHLAAGGRAVILEGDGAGRRIRLYDGGAPVTLARSRPEPAAGGGAADAAADDMASLMFALAAAHGLGIGAGDLRRILGALEAAPAAEAPGGADSAGDGTISS